MDRRLSRGKLVIKARNTVPGEILKIAVGFERSKDPRLRRVHLSTSQAARSIFAFTKRLRSLGATPPLSAGGKITRVQRPTTCCECGRKC